ncbi:hypothetical protein ACFYO1_13230 [Nocardia sp. NPDC006044]|uniref:hypothetical protein n=1 Tax=Nocardia sp. NPDC006044 TaxID=3364306 RepID=UPI0036C8246E
MQGIKRFAAIWSAGLALATVIGLAAGPASAGRSVLTNADDGHSQVVEVGGSVEVRLNAYRDDGLSYSWAVPVSDDAAVLARTKGSTTPNGGATAVFHANEPGTVTITAQRNCRPSSDKTCPTSLTPWKVTITVN